MADIEEKEKIGIILLNLGGPDSLQAVRPFLYSLFSDRQIIPLGPPFLQKPLAWLISTTRAKKTEKFYSMIGGKSPILDITKAQAKALEEALNQGLGVRGQGSVDNSSLLTIRSSLSFKVYVGMRYWRPLIEDVVPLIYRDGIRKLIALNLYPQYSAATSGSSISKFREEALKYPIKTLVISTWFNHPLYIEALIDVIRKGLESFASENDVHVLFSAHSLPERIINEGDPYVEQIKGTIEGIVKRMRLKWHLSFQSKSGPVKWLEPSTEEKLKELSAEGIKKVLVVPVSFVSDHIETLYEIDILYRQMAGGLGIDLRRTESLNTHPIFIEALKDMVMRSVKELGWAE